MHEQHIPDFPLPYEPEQKPTKESRKRYKLFILIFAIVGFVLVAAVSAYLLMNKTSGSDGPAIRSVTYYYRDGKTVLWQGARLAEADSPTFVHAVADKMISKYGKHSFKHAADWKIVTTLDQSLQEVAKQQVVAQQEQLNRQRAEDAALIAQDVTTGQIVSWVGGLEDKLQANGLDRLRSKTQPGTAVMPLVYASYIEKNTSVGAGTVVTDTEGELPGYPCSPTTNSCLKNFDRQYLGEMTLRQALGGLRLVPAVKAMLFAVPDDDSPGRVSSINKTIGTIEGAMGENYGYSCYAPGTDPAAIINEVSESKYAAQCYGASALGNGAYAKPSDLVNAFSTLSNDGKRVPQTYWLRVEQNGKVVEEFKASGGEQAIKEDAAYIISDILSDQSSSYLSKKTYFSIDGKNKVSTVTGIASDAITANAVQYTSKYAVGFWVFGGQSAITGFTELLTLPSTYGWLTAAHQGKEYAERTRPSTIKSLPSPVITLNASTGTIGPSPAVDLYPGWFK